MSTKSFLHKIGAPPITKSVSMWDLLVFFINIPHLSKYCRQTFDDSELGCASRGVTMPPFKENLPVLL